MTGKEKIVLAALLSLTAVLPLVNGYRELKADLETEYARKEIELTAQAQNNVMAWFEDTWPCKGFDIDHNGDKRCTLRQRK